VDEDVVRLVELIIPGKGYYQKLPGGGKRLLRTQYFWYKTELYILGVGGRLLVEWLLSVVMLILLVVYLA
jgi:hypothetical protein